MTLPQLIDARAVGEYRLWLSYDDGRQGEVDLSDELSGGVFEPLRDHEFSKRFTLNPDLHTIQWPNGADFAPEFLLHKLDKTRKLGELTLTPRARPRLRGRGHSEPPRVHAVVGAVRGAMR